MDEETRAAERVEIPISEWPFPWSIDEAEARRTYIFTAMATSEISGDELVKSMAAVDEWIRTGAVPEKGTKRDLKVIK